MPAEKYSFADVTLKKTTLLHIVDEIDGIKTFWFKGALDCQPGQFVMLWIPEVGARPFAVFRVRAHSFALTIASVGEFTEAMFTRPIGSSLGYFGPFGNPFQFRGRHAALVGGGYGAAPLLYLAELYAGAWLNTELIVGARTASTLLYRSESCPPGMVRHECTDDGSAGFQGSAAEKLRVMLESDPTIDMVYTVGPERMMAAVVAVCEKHSVDYQISLERYMKCGYGLCGSCCVDPLGIRMCTEGPILDRKEVSCISEFGVYHRDGTGTKVYF